MIKPVEIVTINKIIPIYKDLQEANAINVINFSFANGDDCGYNVIAQKGLYTIGDKAVYIQPDYCLSDIPLFNSFLRPFGDEKKCKLGKNFRIRAIKFNFQFENTTDPIYSFGILLPKNEVDAAIKIEYDENDLTDILGITKYEEPESAASGQIAGDFPSFMSKTDEENINNIKSKVAKTIASGQQLGIALKVDGSSFTMYVKKDACNEWIYGICSRTQEKKNEQFYISGYVDVVGNHYHKYIDPTTKIKGWFCDAISIFLTDDEIKLPNVTMTPIKVDAKDSWVELATTSGLIEKGVAYCKEHNVQLAFRGEISGQGLKGSGNKLNPDAATKQKLTLFGIDSLDTGFSVRLNYSDTHNLKTVAETLGVLYTHVKIIQPSSYEELCTICDNIFKEEKAKGNVIEGLVIRTMHTNELSTKFMNPEYDARK